MTSELLLLAGYVVFRDTNPVLEFEQVALLVLRESRSDPSTGCHLQDYRARLPPHRVLLPIFHRPSCTVSPEGPSRIQKSEERHIEESSDDYIWSSRIGLFSRLELHQKPRQRKTGDVAFETPQEQVRSRSHGLKVHDSEFWRDKRLSDGNIAWRHARS